MHYAPPERVQREQWGSGLSALAELSCGGVWMKVAGAFGPRTSSRPSGRGPDPTNTGRSSHPSSTTQPPRIPVLQCCALRPALFAPPLCQRASGARVYRAGSFARLPACLPTWPASRILPPLDVNASCQHDLAHHIPINNHTGRPALPSHRAQIGDKK